MNPQFAILGIIMSKTALQASAGGGRPKVVTGTSLVETILSRLVAFPTLPDNHAANQKGLAYVEAFLLGRGMHVVQQEYLDSGVLIATTRPTKQPKIMLVAHLDVVPAPDHLFKMVEQDGKLYGRGVFDMKHAIAAFLAAVDQLGAALPQYDFGILVFTDDESRDQQLGVVLEDGYGCEVAVLPDGGDNWQIESMAKGMIHAAVRLTGKTSHGSRPWEGDSASLKIIDFLHELRLKFAGHGPETDTLNIGLVHSSSGAWNQLPDYAEATIDIRVINQTQQTFFINYLTHLAKKFGAELEIKSVLEPLVHDREHTHLQQFADCIYQVTGVKDQGFLSHGATSAPHFLRYGTPCIITSPPGGGRHSDAEWIDKQGLRHFPDVLQAYLERAAKL